MSLQFAHEFAGVSVPQLNCRLRKSRAGGEHRGGGRGSQSGDAVGMRGEFAKQLAGGGFVEGDLAIPPADGHAIA